MNAILAIVLAYAIGSIPTGYIVTRLVAGSDLRGIGSGGIGATNTQRVLGWRWGLIVALADISKGVAAVLVGRWISTSELVIALCAVAAVVAHCWPVWLRFRGGKGVATGAGAAFALSLWSLPLVPILIIPVLLTRYVSLGSVVAALSAPIIFAILWWTDTAPAEYVLYGVTAAAVVLFKHRGNIERLRAGTERRIGRSVAGGAEPA
jgi:acyl phosphate:glycerol-3-phosphate acyltransferase